MRGLFTKQETGTIMGCTKEGQYEMRCFFEWYFYYLKWTMHGSLTARFLKNVRTKCIFSCWKFYIKGLRPVIQQIKLKYNVSHSHLRKYGKRQRKNACYDELHVFYQTLMALYWTSAAIIGICWTTSRTKYTPMWGRDTMIPNVSERNSAQYLVGQDKLSALLILSISAICETIRTGTTVNNVMLRSQGVTFAQLASSITIVHVHACAQSHRDHAPHEHRSAMMSDALLKGILYNSKL